MVCQLYLRLTLHLQLIVSYQVSIGGDPRGFEGNPDIEPGNNALRIFEPCDSPNGEGCALFEDPATVHLAAARWYPSSVRIFDGSLMIMGGERVIPEDKCRVFITHSDVSRLSGELGVLQYPT